MEPILIHSSEAGFGETFEGQLTRSGVVEVMKVAMVRKESDRRPRFLWMNRNLLQDVLRLITDAPAEWTYGVLLRGDLHNGDVLPRPMFGMYLGRDDSLTDAEVRIEGCFVEEDRYRLIIPETLSFQSFEEYVYSEAVKAAQTLKHPVASVCFTVEDLKQVLWAEKPYLGIKTVDGLSAELVSEAAQRIVPHLKLWILPAHCPSCME